MSYILDALRRADSDRERGAVPSLHSNTISAALPDADEADASSRSVQPLWWAVGGLSIALLAMMGWLVFGRAVPAPEPARAPDVVAAAPVLVPPPPAAPVLPVLPAPVAPDPQQAQRAEIEAPAAPTPTPKAARKPVKPVAKPDNASTAAAPAAEAEAPVPSISELPDDVRRQLPALSVSGASYSKNAASRMIVLNGQVFREGDKVANDVVLEQIRLKSAVLSFKGRRYSINF